MNEPSEINPRRTVVVAASSRHGSTGEIAARLAEVMSSTISDRWIVRLGDLDESATFDDADAVVLGSAVYLGHWLRPALKALREVKDAELLDLWLFSSGPISDELGENARVITADEMVQSGCAVEHVVFAGRLDGQKLGRSERLVTRLVGAGSGDRRDWAAIDAWGRSIATQLSAATSCQLDAFPS